MDAIVLVVRHSVFMDLDPDEVVRAVGKLCAVVDCFAILDDDRDETLRLMVQRRQPFFEYKLRFVD